MQPQFKDLGELFTNGSFSEAMKWGFSKLKSANSVSQMSRETLKKYKKIMEIGEDGLSALTSSQIKEIGKKSGYKQSLIKETLLKASDADFLSKASITGLKWSDAVKDTSNLEDLRKLLLERARTDKDLLNSKQIEYLSQKGLSTEKLQKGLESTINSSKKLQDSLISTGDAGKSSFTAVQNTAKGVALSLKSILPLLLGVTAAYIAFNQIDKSEHSYTDTINKTKDSIQEYQQTTSEVESLNQQLEQTQERIDELKSQGTLTLTDQAELEKLQEQNAELERQLAIKEALQQIQKDNAERNVVTASKAKKSYTELQENKYGSVWGRVKSAFDHISTGYNIFDFVMDKDARKEILNSFFGLKPGTVKSDTKYGLVGGATGSSLASKEMKGKDTTAVGILKSSAADLDEYQKQYIKNQLALKKDPTNKELLSQQEFLNKSISETSETLSTQSDLIQSWIEACADSTDTETRAMVDQWQKALGQVQNIGKSKLQRDVNNLNTFFSTNSGQTIKKYLEDIVTKSGDASDALLGLGKIGLSVDEIGVSGDNFLQYFQDIIDGSSSVTEAVEDMSDTLIGTYDNLAAAIESANGAEKFDNLKTWYASIKEMYEKGDVGTDDFQTMAQFGVGYNIKKRLANGNYKYKAEAYVEAYQQAEQMLERWYGGDDEAANTQNIINDFVSAGLMKYNAETDDYTVLKDNFKNTAQAAQALGTSIDNVEAAMGKLEDKSFEFDDVDKSGELFKDYQSYLDKIKEVKDSLNDGYLKKNLSKQISGWNTELDQFDNDLSTLTEPKVIEIKFEYDLASAQQKVQEAAELARSSGENSDWAAAVVAQKNERRVLEDHTQYSETSNDEGFKNSDAVIDKIYMSMNGKSDEERTNLNQMVYGLQELQNTFLDLKSDGFKLDWNEFLSSDQAKSVMSDIQKNTGLTKDELVDLATDSYDFKIDADTSNAEGKIKDLKGTLDSEPIFSFDKMNDQIRELMQQGDVGQEITFTANMDNVITQINAVKEEDGSISFWADTGDVEQKIEVYKNEDGSISFVPDTSMVEDKIQQMAAGETVTFYANIDGMVEEVSAYKDIDGDISYTIKNQEKPLPQNADMNYIISHQENPGKRNASVYYTYAGQDAPGSRTAPIEYRLSGGGQVAITQADRFNGTANASGNWGVQKSETSLVGELGPEIIVRNGRYFTVGENGAEFTDVRRGDVIFNHKQSMELLKNGYVTSSGGRAKVIGEAFINGTAYNNGGFYKTYTPLVPTKKDDNKKTNSKSSSGSSSSRNSGSSSGGSTRSSSGGSSGGSSSSSDAKSTTEEVVDFIKIMLSRLSRMTELATDAIERAVGLANKQAAAADAIGRATNEMVHNQRAADAYLAKANSISLSDAYKNQIMNGSINIDTITDEDLKKKISDFQSYYESYLSARDNALKLEDKITELAEKRLEIITDTYDAIVDINDSIKSVADSKISLNDALGVAIDNPDNYANLNNSIKAQEDTYNQLTKKLSDYQKEVNSQLSSGYLKKGSEAYQAAMKNIQDFTAKIYDASTSLLELRDKLDQIKIDSIQNVIDGIKRNSDITEKYISYLQSQNRDVPENLYTDRIDNNNAQVQQNLKQMEIYRKKQAVLDVNSKSYQDYAEKIQTLKENTLELITDNESLQDSIYELRFKPLDDAIQKYSDLEDELKSFRDLLNDDAFLDKQGRITEEGLAQVALLQQSIGTAKQKIADYTTGLQKLKDSYDNGVISLTEYNDKSKDYREGIQGSIADVKSYQDSLVDLYKNAMSTEVDYLDKIIEKRKSALQAKADYYSYDKSISKKSNDINAIKAQIMALEGVKYLLL